MKQSKDIKLPHLTKSFVNYAINGSNFPAELKLSEVIPLSKKKDTFKKEDYRPMTILPHVPKVIEKIIFEKINV